MDLYELALLDAPDVADEPFCAVCGRPARDRHHVIVRGMGGRPAEVERRIPVIRLCGRGNASGCHGLAHGRRLQLWWDGSDWLYRVAEPMTLQEAVEGHLAEFSELPGWRRQRQTVTFGRGERWERASGEKYPDEGVPVLALGNPDAHGGFIAANEAEEAVRRAVASN